MIRWPDRPGLCGSHVGRPTWPARPPLPASCQRGDEPAWLHCGRGRVGVEPSIPVEQLSVVSARGIPDLSMDLVYVNGLTEHVDLRWDHPLMARFLERLASFSPAHQVRSPRRRRLHPVPLDALPTWEEWAEDLRAVLDAVGSERAAIYAELDAGPVEMIFAATHPERTSALVLGNTMARYSMAGDPAFLRWRAEFTRASATPPHGRGPVSLHLQDGRAVGAGHHHRPDPGAASVQLLPRPRRARPLPGGTHPRSEVRGGRRTGVAAWGPQLADAPGCPLRDPPGRAGPVRFGGREVGLLDA